MLIITILTISVLETDPSLISQNDKPADWQHVPGIDDAAYSSQPFDNYQEAVDYCQRNGGKVFEPTQTTNNLVANWAEEKASYSYFWLGIKWNKKKSEFQHQSNGTRISWSNFWRTSLTITSCEAQSCLDDNSAVQMYISSGSAKWNVRGRGEKLPTVCETTVS